MTEPAGLSLSGRQPKAIQSALRVLEAVATSGAGVTAKEVAHGLGIPSATTYRLINILVADGYLVRLPDLRGFALGRRIGGLLAPPPPQAVCHAAHQAIAELRSRTRFALHLVLYLRDAVRVLDSDPDHPALSEQTLTRFLHASAVGKLLLAEQVEWRDIYPEGRLVALTDRTITRGKALDTELATCRSTGQAHQIAELRPDVACLAVTIRSISGTLIGAIAAAGPNERYDALAELVDPMRECAVALSPLLA